MSAFQSLASSINSSTPSYNTLSPTKKLRFDDRSVTQVSLSLKAYTNLAPNSPPSYDKNELAIDFFKWSETETITRVINSRDFVGQFGAIVHFGSCPFYVAFGTSKGFIVGFNYHQAVEFILAPTDETEDSGPFNGLISTLAFSSDCSFIAGGYTNGQIILWDITTTSNAEGLHTRKTGPYFNIYPTSLQNRFTNNSQGHLLNTPINSVSFIGDLHNKLVSSDISGLVFFHFGFKKFLKKYFTTQKLLGRNDANLQDEINNKYLILDCQLLPLGTSHQITDQIGLLAVMTSNILVIVSVLSLNNPHNINPITQFKIGRSNLVHPKSIFGCLSWFPCVLGKNKKIGNAMLAYSWNNVLTILEIHNDKLPSNLLQILADLRDKDKGIPNIPITKSCRWLCPKKNDSIVFIKWLSSDKLLLGIKDFKTSKVKILSLYYRNNRLSLVGEDNVNGSLLHNYTYDMSDTTSVSSYNSVQMLKDRLMLFTQDLKLITGRCLTWADRLVEYLAKGNYSAALIAANEYYNSKNKGQLVLAGLPEDDHERRLTVKPYLLQIMNQSMIHIFSDRDDLTADHEDPEYFLKMYLDIMSYLSDDLSSILESLFELYDNQEIFFDTLETYILTRGLTKLSPTILKSLVEYFTKNNKGDTLTEIICSLDTNYLDIDLTLNLCDKYGLRECSIYIWNYLLHDYTTPFMAFIKAIRQFDMNEDLQKVYVYLSYVFTGKQYPTERYIDINEEQAARESICGILFSISLVEDDVEKDTSIFPYLNLLLQKDSFEMLSTLNEFFENPCLNDNPKSTFNRQYIIEALMDIFDTNSAAFNQLDHIQLSIFLARNYPKYSQFIRLSESILSRVIDNLCSNTSSNYAYDCELALQSLLPLYEPEDDSELLEKLKSAKFFDVLINIYRNDNKHDKVLQIWLERFHDQHFGHDFHMDTMNQILTSGFSMTKENIAERLNFVNVIRENFEKLMAIDSDTLYRVIDKYNRPIHTEILNISDETMQLHYLHEMFTTGPKEKDIPQFETLIATYIELLYKFNRDSELLTFTHDYVEVLSHDASLFNRVKKSLKEHESIEGLTVLQVYEGQYQQALDELIEVMKKTIKSLNVVGGGLNEVGNESGNVLEQENNERERIKIPSDEDKPKSILRLHEKFTTYFECASKICEHPHTYDNKETISLNENMWLQLLDNLVLMASSSNQEVSETINEFIYSTFRKIIDTKLDPTAKDTESREKSFLVIFNKFLDDSSMNAKLATLSNIRLILQEVFISYSYESELLNISVRMINEEIYKDLKHIKADKLVGWDIKSKTCTSCGKPMWGEDVPLSDHYQAWEARQSDRLVLSPVHRQNQLMAVPFVKDSYLHCELTLFKCSHGYHSTCLHNLGAKSDNPSCVICSQ